jgi:tRNA threonylcarbamoyladenosine biosynthesis protein TsaB
MGELYWGCYEAGEDGLVTALEMDRLLPPQEVTWPEGGDWYGAGSGWRTYGEQLAERMGAELIATETELQASAHDVVLLAQAALQRGVTLSPEEALPVYLREEVAKKPAKLL